VGSRTGAGPAALHCHEAGSGAAPLAYFGSGTYSTTELSRHGAKVTRFVRFGVSGMVVAGVKAEVVTRVASRGGVSDTKGGLRGFDEGVFFADCSFGRFSTDEGAANFGRTLDPSCTIPLACAATNLAITSPLVPPTRSQLLALLL